MIGRLLTVYATFCRHRLDALLPDQRPPLLALALAVGTLGRSVPAEARGIRLRRALEELGPVFIKFGQLLSTRRDLLPDDIADELALLQDTVPPFPVDRAVAIIEQSLANSVDVLFADFEQTPLAAASVAQVHGATLPTGERVVVKVLRPDIEPVIRADLALIKRLAFYVSKLFKDGKRLRPVEVAADYERTLLDELDLRREAGNASQLRRNFLDSGLVYVPEVHWPLVTTHVMVSERIQGIPVSDIAALTAQKVNMRLLAERGVEIFFTQVFRDSFFHADMHPGNIFVDANDPEDPRYLAVDCAIVGQLDESDLYYLARNLLAIFKQDYRLVAKLHVECGWVPANTPIAEFEAAMRTLCEPVFERPLGEISFGHMLVTLFRTAGRFNMEVQPQLVLLQKTLLNIEGLGRQLYPQLSLWDTAQPFLERWLAERYAPQTLLKRLQQDAPAWLETLPLVPDLLLAKLKHREVPKPTPVTHRGWLPLGVAGAALALYSLAQSPSLPWLAAAGAGIFALAVLQTSRR
jgi:ubiquinone biosynthesis protein